MTTWRKHLASSLTPMSTLFSRTVGVVAHSHWDREWYAPLESYRARLVSMMDGLLDLLESDDGFEHFHLDGQAAIVDDYLAVRPEAADRLAKLVAGGRLAVGPWYVLMDEFCVSAETIVRNLQRGLAGLRILGGGSADAARPVGYLPDMFGHVAQMPQILAQAGLAHAVVWRGVPAAIENRAFWWEAPDGTRVRAEYLPAGYASGAFLPKDAGDLIRRMAAHEAEVEPFTGPDGAILLMNGGDHQNPQPWLPALLREANEAQDHFRFSQTALAAFLAGQPCDDLPVWSGELRSGARAPLLMGVLSNRVDVKQAAARCETALERLAEPLAALWLPPDMWPADQLERAWLESIRNSAHDSVCGCSADPVARTVLARYDTVQAVAEDVIASAVAIAGVATAATGPLILNSLPAARGGVVELDLPGRDTPAGAQQLQSVPAGVTERHGRGRDLARILGELTDEGWLGPSAKGVAARLALDGPLVLVLEHDASRAADPAMAPVVAEAWARAGAGRDEPLTVRVERAASQRVAVRADDVPGWGWAIWRPAGLSHAPVSVEEGATTVEVANGLAHVSVERSDGTFALDGVSGQNRLTEEADEGDTYNFSAVPGRPPSTAPEQVTVETVERGPVRAVVRVIRRYPWDGGTTVVSDLSLCTGEDAVRVTTSLDHRGRDHRIRAVFPLGERAVVTEAECAFATTVRGRAEGGPHEPALSTFPSRRFVTAGPLTVTHEGLLEHELVEEGTALAVTLLRATGVLSRPAPPARPNVAGPPVELRDAQLPGPQTFRYALVRGCRDPWGLADRIWTPLIALAAGGHGHLPERGRRLELAGARVSALRRCAGALEVRVFNPGPSPTTVQLPGHAGTLVDLQGEPVGDWRDSFDLGPWSFATARLEAISLDPVRQHGENGRR